MQHAALAALRFMKQDSESASAEAGPFPMPVPSSPVLSCHTGPPPMPPSCVLVGPTLIHTLRCPVGAHNLVQVFAACLVPHALCLTDTL